MIAKRIKFLTVITSIVIGMVLLAVWVQPKYYLSIGAIFRNEARFLPEWIEYHRMRGVQHFYLFNNLSEDDYQTALKPYVDKGIVELYQWPFYGNNQKEWNKIQCSAYTKLLKEKKFETFWLAIIDTDEFLAPTQISNLQTFLKPYEPFGGVAINWQLFGTSHIDWIPSSKTVIGSLTKKATPSHPSNLFVKSIVQPRKVKKMSQPHFCYYHRPFYHVTEKFERFPSKSLTEYVSVETIRIHHYTYRDRSFFNGEKQKRYAEWHPDAPPVQENPSYNEVEDLLLQPYVNPIECKLAVK